MKIPGKNKRPGQGRAFYQPLSRDSADAPYSSAMHRYAGRYDPGQHGRIYDKRAENPPLSSLPLFLFHNTERKETFLETLEKLDIPLRDFRQESFGCMLSPERLSKE